jgi:hypothetical protein
VSRTHAPRSVRTAGTSALRCDVIIARVRIFDIEPSVLLLFQCFRGFLHILHMNRRRAAEPIGRPRAAATAPTHAKKEFRSAYAAATWSSARAATLPGTGVRVPPVLPYRQQHRAPALPRLAALDNHALTGMIAMMRRVSFSTMTVRFSATKN